MVHSFLLFFFILGGTLLSISFPVTTEGNKPKPEENNTVSGMKL